MAQGLAALKKVQQENREREEARNRPKADWFKWPKGVTVATVRFLQEIDEDAPHYDPERGLAHMEIEHQAPGSEGYKRRASCSLETEGKCYACERHQANYKEGWGQKQNFYVNALVKFADEEPKVLLIQRNFNSTFAANLLQEAEDEGSITNANYRVTKSGTGTQTQWLLKRLDKDTPLDDSKAEVFDIEETALRKIPYSKQPDYFGAVYKGTAATESEAAADEPTPDDEDW
jgi:hypothetical protein